MSTQTPAAERFKAGYEPVPNGCWEWRRARNSRGYGVMYLDGKVRLAHRVSWLLAHGRWPLDGLVVDHICNHRPCVNPSHLRELTSGQNIMRAYPRGDDRQERQRALWRGSAARLRARRKEMA